jgi:hypothetical protein
MKAGHIDYQAAGPLGRALAPAAFVSGVGPTPPSRRYLPGSPASRASGW